MSPFSFLLNLSIGFASFTASPVQGEVPLTAQFTDNSEGTPVRWLYNFGDGFTSSLKNPRYTYRKPGTYTVSLTVWKFEGSTLVNTMTRKPALITVRGKPVPVLSANFTAEPLSGSAPLSVTFTDASTGDPRFWSYEFVDGSTSSLKNPVHTYRSPGTYTVIHTVTSLEGSTILRNTTIKENLITVGGGPGPVLAANFTVTYQPRWRPMGAGDRTSEYQILEGILCWRDEVVFPGSFQQSPMPSNQ